MLIEAFIASYLRHANKSLMHFENTPHAELPAPQPGRRYMLYLHVPFCEVLCPFCSFHRVKLRHKTARAYFRALRREIRRYHELGFEFASVYVGGGTPTVLPEELGETLDLVRSLYRVQEISVETNPNDLEEEVLTILETVGVNRLSVGIQSFDDRLLKEMGRYEKYGSGAEIVERLRHAQGRFDTLNADMIFNLPHQSIASLENDLQILTQELPVDQVTFYPLMASSTTQKTMWRQAGNGHHNQEKRFYDRILEALQPHYRPSSAWCFSRTAAMLDEYIVEHDEYVGAGSGSFSYMEGTTFANTFSIERYISDVNQGQSPITAVRCYDRHQQMQYGFLMGLFGLAVDRTAMESRYGPSFFRALWKEFLVFRLLGAIRQKGGQYRLTRRGMYYWVIMMREFFTGVNNFRDQMRSQIVADRSSSLEQDPALVKAAWKVERA